MSSLILNGLCAQKLQVVQIFFTSYKNLCVLNGVYVKL
jgi:hypothetical protein